MNHWSLCMPFSNIWSFHLTFHSWLWLFYTLNETKEMLSLLLRTIDSIGKYIYVDFTDLFSGIFVEKENCFVMVTYGSFFWSAYSTANIRSYQVFIYVNMNKKFLFNCKFSYLLPEIDVCFKNNSWNISIWVAHLGMLNVVESFEKKRNKILFKFSVLYWSIHVFSFIYKFHSIIFYPAIISNEWIYLL